MGSDSAKGTHQDPLLRAVLLMRGVQVDVGVVANVKALRLGHTGIEAQDE